MVCGTESNIRFGEKKAERQRNVVILTKGTSSVILPCLEAIPYHVGRFPLSHLLKRE